MSALPTLSTSDLPDSPESPSRETRRIALVIQYLGTQFHGWQRQLQQRTVQAVIEDILTLVLGHPVILHAAGRTDAGVHAAAQVAHFDDPDSPIPAHRWADILNSRLPEDVVIRASQAVSLSWHARFSAIWRRYRYTIYTDPRPNLFVRALTWHYYHAFLDEQLIQQALTPLMGRYHLSAFHRAGSGRSHSWVDVQAAECIRRDPFLEIEVQASGFLYGMMRLLVGLLVQVGRGQRSPQSFTELWRTERREEVTYSAPAKGLCLLRVGYLDPPFPPQVWYDAQPRLLLPTEFSNLDSGVFPETVGMPSG
jgi:tRNA pseudouridine38-40 synthase